MARVRKGRAKKKSSVGLFERGTTLIATSEGPQAAATPFSSRSLRIKGQVCVEVMNERWSLFVGKKKNPPRENTDFVF